jgi:hypothetical protein
MARIELALIAFGIAALTAAGCGDGSPTSPSVAGADTAAVVGAGAESDPGVGSDPPDSSRVELKGLAAGLGGACPNLSFTINGQPVITSFATKFDDGFCGSIQNGTWVEVKGSGQPDGSVLAHKIDIDHSAPEVKLEAKVEGVASGVGGACPALTFSVNGTRVVAHAFTRYEDGVCGSIQNGAWVEVKGPQQPDGSLLASKIDIDYPSPFPSQQVDLRGSPSKFSGVCPDVAFVVIGQSVVTNGATRFKNGVCGFLPFARWIEVEGVRQPDGTFLALIVEIDD